MKLHYALSLLFVGCAAQDPAPHAAPETAVETEEQNATESSNAALAAVGAKETVTRVVTTRAQEILLNADTFDVLRVVDDRPAFSDEEEFHGYPRVGSVRVASGASRVRLLEALYTGIDEGSSFAMCFEPHHGVRARRGAEWVDVVICFECTQLQVYDGEQHASKSALEEDETSDHTWAPISDAARPALEKLLAGVPTESERVGGASIEEWVATLTVRLEQDPRPDALEPKTQAMIVELTRWHLNGWGDQDVRSLLGNLGPLAAPAIAPLRESLTAGDPYSWLVAFEILRSLGTVSAPAVPELTAILERDFTPMLEARLAYDAQADAGELTAEEEEFDPPGLSEDELEDVLVGTLRALREIGAAAESAIPALERVAAGDHPMLAQEASAVLKQIKGD